ncbi:hypothetical protein NPIL_500671 [Nephila pilipes]|uniref:Uncharacterized protein n=1 Tax=Nephila pilipes TaxID=299642 RepID=A0A8X6U1F7_NEPPI|nr:hypothetical protein NPIL_500671 [Nephila pilipes]
MINTTFLFLLLVYLCGIFQNYSATPIVIGIPKRFVIFFFLYPIDSFKAGIMSKPPLLTEGGEQLALIANRLESLKEIAFAFQKVGALSVRKNPCVTVVPGNYLTRSQDRFNLHIT